MTQKFIMVLLSIGFFQLARGQSISPQVIANSGKYSSVGGNSIEFTVGELVVSTLNSAGNMVTQGFHQTYSVGSSINEQELKFTIHVYPNPSIDVVNISLDGQQLIDFSVTIHDGYGRKVLDQFSSNQSQLQLNIEGLSSGSYFITLCEIKTHIPIKTIQIQKLSNQ